MRKNQTLVVQNIKWYSILSLSSTNSRGSRLEMLLGKSVLKICSKFTGEYSCRSVISLKLQSNFNETTLWDGCSPINLLHIFRTPFPKNTFGQLLL